MLWRNGKTGRGRGEDRGKGDWGQRAPDGERPGAAEVASLSVAWTKARAARLSAGLGGEGSVVTVSAGLCVCTLGSS